MEEKLSLAITTLWKEDATVVFTLARTQQQISNEANKALADISTAIESLVKMYVQKYELDEGKGWELIVNDDQVSIRERVEEQHSAAD